MKHESGIIDKFWYVDEVTRLVKREFDEAIVTGKQIGRASGRERV